MAIGIRGFAAIIAMAALMVIGVACGNGAEPASLSDEAPTPAPPIVSGTTPTAPIVSHGGPVKDYVSLVDNLRAAGATVDPAGSVSQPFFAPQGQMLTVTGEDVQAFEFASVEEADTVAETVSADGSSIGTSMVRWIAPPHFYKAGKLIVIYVGGEGDVIDVLQEAMGPQFAGGESLPPAPGAQSVPPVTSTMMVPRPESIEVLVRMSHIIVLGTISAVLDEKLIGAYGEDGNPYVPVEETGSPFTDYEVRVESVLKNDGDVEDGGTLVLRMPGHLSQQSDVVTLAEFQLPQPGSHYLLALGRNLDGTYGSGNEGLISVDGEGVAFADGVAFSTELTGDEFVEAVRQEATQ